MSQDERPEREPDESNRSGPGYQHSGSGTSSPPRRPGIGERQGLYVRHSGDHVPVDLPLIPGEVLYGDDPVVINAGKDVIKLRVVNTADRPIQVGSHYHFAEANPGLEFDRAAAWGRRLNVLSGGSMRFEPGAAEEVELIPIGGERIMAGLRGECGGKLDDKH
jgi:urease subunit beta